MISGLNIASASGISPAISLSRAGSPRSRPAEGLADEPAEHAARGGEMVARERDLAGVALAVLGIIRGSGPGIGAVRLHVEEHLFADLTRTFRVLLPGDEAAQSVAAACREAYFGCAVVAHPFAGRVGGRRGRRRQN